MHQTKLKLLDYYVIIPPKRNGYIEDLDLFIDNTNNYEIHIYPATTEQYIGCLHRLIDIAADSLGLNESSGKERPGLAEILDIYRDIYKKISLHMLLQYQNIVYEDFKNDPYNHMASTFLSKLQLIQNTHKKYRIFEDDISWKGLDGPQSFTIVNKNCSRLDIESNKIWFSCMYASLVNNFSETGISDKEPKVDTTNNICKKIVKMVDTTIEEIEAHNRSRLTIPISEESKIINHNKNDYLHGFDLILDKAIDVSFENDCFFEDYVRPNLMELRKASSSIKRIPGYFTFFLDRNGNIKHRRQGKPPSQSKSNKNKIDWESMPSEELKKHKSKDASQEKLNRCFQAIVNHNKNVDPDITQMILVNENTLKILSACSLTVVKKWVKENQKAFDEEKQKYKLSKHHNKNLDITQVITW